MAPTSLEILYITEIILYVPTLVASIFVVNKHGVAKKVGWRFLTMVSLFRLIGATTGLAAIHDPSAGLIETSDIMQSFGLSSLLAATIGILTRVNNGKSGKVLPAKLFSLISLPLLAGMIVSIIGSTNIFNEDPVRRAHGYTYLKAAVCLFTSVFVLVAAITIHLVFSISHIGHSDRRLAFSVMGSVPLIAVRIMYSLLCIFTEGSKWFSAYSKFSGAVALHGVLGVFPEFVVVVTFLFAGLTAPSLKAQSNAKGSDVALEVQQEA